MKQSHAKLFRAFLFALLAAGGFATAGLIAQGVCGSPLACFEPGQEREIWQALTPFGQINDPSCTNSAVTASRVREDSRQCTRDDEQPVPQPYPVLMPPSLGQFLDPFAIAVDSERIYISDQSNHRIQAFKFDGTPIRIAHPIGDGVAGMGPYPPYPADSRMTGNSDPITGQRLSSPDGLAVDANGKLVVGDYSGYINVFNPDGSPAFGTMASPQRLQIMDTVNGVGDLGTKASGIAMTPGTVVHGIGVTPPPGDTNRIVVTDRLNCFVYIYDSGFNLLRQIPEIVPDGAEQGACYWDELAAPLGLFSSPVAAAIDSQGRIYISDYDNNRIQILDGNGDPLGEFGREVLQYPWGIVVDHKGRVAVADTENQRIAFFTMDYSGASPVATYVFELDAKGTLNGYPTAIAEQVGTAAGLDPAGRFLTTDTLNNRIQRFQLPDLAIINKVVLPGGFGSFQVVVPDGKAAPVEFVGVSAVGTGATVLTLNGVLPGNPVSLNPIATAQENATPVLGTTIAPGQIATYHFTFSAGGQSGYSFKFNAVGNDGATAADEVQVDASMPCLDCVSTHQLFVAPGPPTVPATSTGVWYNTQLTVRINATTPHAGGLSGIAYQFLSGPESSGQRWGGSVHLVPVTGNAASIDFPVNSQGESVLRYWAIGGDGTVEVSHPLTLSLDLSLPDVVFTFPAANAAGWNNTAVNAIYTVNDAPSGPATGPATLSFPNEGRQQFQTVSASDAAGNVLADVASHLSTHAGRYLNIDTTAPVLAPPPSLNITIPAAGPGYAVAPATFVATATDPDLNDARPGADVSGSGVDLLASTLGPGATQFPVGGPTTFTFVATDVAGNTASLTGSVTVIRATTTIAAPDQIVQYGQPMVVTASLGTNFATGQVTFTFGPSGAYSVVGSAAGGLATATVPPGLLDVGTHTMQVSYAGDLSVSPAATTAQVTVDPAPITITAQPVGRSVGAVDPPLTYTVTGSLVGTDAFSGGLLRQSGEMPGVYPILRNTLTPGPNYAVTYIGADFTIAQETIEVFATASGKTYGDADPLVFGFTHTGNLIAGVNFSGTLARDAGESVGAYGMNQGNLSLPAGFNIVYHPAPFTVNARSVTVTAGSGTKAFGSEDPGLVPTDNGFLAADNIVLSQTRASGESVGNYATAALATGAALSNYQVAYVPGNLAITPAIVSVSALPQAMTYGDSQPAFTYAYGSFPTAGYSAATVGTAPLCGVQVTQVNVGAHTIQCGGAADDNLTFVYHTAVLTVSPKAVTIAVTSKSRPFGAADPAFDAVESGVVPGDTLNYTLSTTAVQLSPVGGYPITAHPGSNPNYTVQVTDGTLTVDPAAVTITANPESKVYGDPNPGLDAVVDGVPPGEALAYTMSTAATPTSGVGSHPITVLAGANPNYSVTVVDSELTVTSRPVAVTANAHTITYGDAEPSLTYAFTGGSLVGSDAFAGGLIRTPGTGVGSYPISQGSLALNANYSLSFTGANLTINLAPATVTAGSGTKVYGSADPAITASATGFLASDGIGLSASRVTGENVGPYATTATAAGAALPNYNVTYVLGSFSITRAPATVTAAGGTKVYGTADPAITASGSGFFPADGIVITGSRVAGENVNSYTTSGIASGAAAGNYEINAVTGTFTITRKAASVTASNAQKVEGAAEPVLPVSSLGFLPSDAIVISASRVAGTTPGTYVITPLATGAAVGNYTIAYTPAVFTIVNGNRAPVCSTAYGGEIWPPNHKKFYAAPVRGVTDPEGGPVTVLVTGIWQDEKIDSTGDGQFSPDGNGVGTSTAWVRAERNGHGNKAAGNGRVYEIMFAATDNRGARCTGSVFYTVPHDQGQRATAIDSVTRYDSTGVVPGTRDKGQIHQHRQGSTEGCSNTKHDHDNDNDWSHNGSKYQGKSRDDNDDDDRCENPQHDHRKDGDWQHRRRR